MEKSKVYFTDFSAKPNQRNLLEKLRHLVKTAGIEQLPLNNRYTAIKIHFGEPGNLAYLRPNYAKVRAQDRNGEWFEAEGEELIARCFCHELDHLDGIVYTEVMERFLTEEELERDE